MNYDCVQMIDCEKVFLVPANLEYGIDTGLNVSRGQPLLFIARGVVSLDSRHHFVIADGFMCNDELGEISYPLERYELFGELLPAQRAGVLFGWFGDYEAAKAFYIGSVNVIYAEYEGSLHLAVNDLKGSYGDNSGVFVVSVRGHEGKQ